MRADHAELLVRTNPGTGMGTLMRRYWVPVMLASEVAEPDCPPVRVKILGERLLAFRDTAGRIGLVDEFCRHRGASLFLGRNEEGGIRCSFHGWKYDVTGACVELPQQSELACQASIKAYPAIEMGDIVWAYMGPPELQPEPPDLEWAHVPAENRFVSKRLQECNWLQAMEGGIDTAHASWVHRFEMRKDPMHKGAAGNAYIESDPNPIFTCEPSDGGLYIFARRNAGEEGYYWRITQWIMPWFTLIPPFGHHALGAHIWVPIDDENCWAWSINFYPDRPIPEEELSAMRAGKGIHVEYIPGTFIPKANRSNDWLIDRVAQKQRDSFSGVDGFSIQDASLQESMDPIQDRTREMLVQTDMAIMRARRRLLSAIRDLQADPATPVPGGRAEHQKVRAATAILPRDVEATEWARERLAAVPDRPVETV